MEARNLAGRHSAEERAARPMNRAIKFLYQYKINARRRFRCKSRGGGGGIINWAGEWAFQMARTEAAGLV